MAEGALQTRARWSFEFKPRETRSASDPDVDVVHRADRTCSDRLEAGRHRFGEGARREAGPASCMSVGERVVTGVDEARAISSPGLRQLDAPEERRVGLPRPGLTRYPELIALTPEAVEFQLLTDEPGR